MTPGTVTTSLKRRRRWLKRFAVLFLVVVAYFGFIAARLFLFQPELEIGPETTVVEGPLRPDGTVDYVAALNDEWSQGVTPENNAAIPLMEAFGPSTVNPAIRDEFFERLGLAPLPEEGDYLVPIDKFVEEQDIDDTRREELFAMVGEADVPAIEADYPELVTWVEHNADPLAKIIEAVRREEFYMPVVPVPPGTTLLDAGVYNVTSLRDAARLLTTATLVHLQRGEIEAACEHAIAAHRLGRLVGRYPNMVGYLVGVAIDAMASKCSETVILSGQLTPELAKQFRNDLDALPPIFDTADSIDRGERLVLLSSVQQIAKGSPGSIMPTAFPGRVVQGLDANVMLRDINRFYDQVVAAMREGDYRERQRRLGETRERQQAWLESKPTAFQLAWMVLTGNRTAISRQVSKVLISLLFPAVEQVQVAEDRTVMRSQLLKVACALAEYRAVEGGYPESLDALHPTYLDEIPVDFYADAPLKYRRVGEAFLLYSVGANGKDDGGLTFGEGESNDYDDLRFGVAPAEAPAAD